MPDGCLGRCRGQRRWSLPQASARPGWSERGSLVDGKSDWLAVDLHRRHGVGVSEGAVGPAVVVEAEEGLQVRVGVYLGAVALQVNLVVLHGAPEALDEDVVEGAAAPIHRDLDPAGQERLGKLGRGKLA